MSDFQRVVWIVLDSVGIGAMPDAAAYGDGGSNTLGNLARVRPLRLPNLSRLGIANVEPLAGLAPPICRVRRSENVLWRRRGKTPRPGIGRWLESSWRSLSLRILGG